MSQAPAPAPPATPSSLPPTVRRLGWLHFANDFTLDFATPFLAAGVPPALLGLMESLADAAAQGLKLVTGRASDASGRRVGWVRAGYAANAVFRPLASIGLWLAWPWWIVACRVGDRVGKGLRGSASDALVADWCSGPQRATAFARMRTLDHLGATAGALAAVLLVLAVGDSAGAQAGLVAALVLPALAMIAWCAGLHDAPKPPAAPSAAKAWWPAGRRLNTALAVLAVGSLGAKIAPTLVLVQVAGIPLDDSANAWPLWAICLGWAVLGLAQAGAAALAGSLTSRLGPRAFLAAGWLAGGLVFAGLAVLSGWALAAAGLGWAVLSGFTEGAEKTWLADLAPADQRGAAFGALGIVQAVAALAGSSLVGWGLGAWGPLVFIVPAAALGLAALLATSVAWAAGPSPTRPAAA